MLKRRIIPLELLNDDRLIKTLAFDSPRDVGDPLRSSQVYSDQDADEIVLLNVSRNKRDVNQLVKSVYKIAQQCFVPLTVGGGIKCIKDAERLFAVGADKIVLNSAA